MKTGSFSLAVALGLGLAFGGASAQASVVNESDVGVFSSLWNQPTEIGSDVTGITGTTAGNVYDIFRIAVPASGAEIELNFSAGDRVNDSYAAGTVVKYSYSPFQWGWDGTELGSIALNVNNQTSNPLKLTLDPNSGTEVFVALYNTHGVMDYNITGLGSAASNVTLPPVPVPAAAILLGTAAGGLGLAGALRRRRQGGKA